ncbi:3-hydroxyacyl-CoA dehydrogenase type-2-like [Sitodiplosis mosellana]|uniref:3-hydroxyacyl-CoA dehydrogenase type-2-like n=1 Tax=Sitodiplosis mosellana TaxID=263140 RepID=UPI0024442706|nr:3-hydroxyacyl-CoA dehydrogenase type-2-like [Sitodiplosis mosellana]
MFKNLVTLVTGGASGLGRATANRFALKGSQVVFCDLPTSNGQEIVKEIGENVHYIPADVTSETDVQNLVEEISKKYGKLDILVNCAGLADAHVTYNFRAKTPRKLDDFEKVLKTNVLGTFNVIRLSAGLIGKNEPDENGLRGVIVNTSGTEAFRGTLGQTALAAACGAIHSMTRPLALDLSDQGIRVVSIAPGFIRTPLLDYIPSETTEAISQECIISPKRFGDPDEFAHVVQSIVTNPYINATTIEVSGGIQMNL